MSVNFILFHILFTFKKYMQTICFYILRIYLLTKKEEIKIMDLFSKKMGKSVQYFAAIEVVNITYSYFFAVVTAKSFEQ